MSDQEKLSPTTLCRPSRLFRTDCKVHYYYGDAWPREERPQCHCAGFTSAATQPHFVSVDAPSREVNIPGAHDFLFLKDAPLDFDTH